MTLETNIKEMIESAAQPITVDEIVNAERELLVRPKRGRTPRVRMPLLAVAAAVTVVAGSAIWIFSSTQSGDVVDVAGTPDAVKPLVVGDWELLDDPNGVFEPADLVDSREANGGTQFGTSQLLVSGIAATPDGHVAVGAEQVGFFSVAAVWSSVEGSPWERHAIGSPAFGTLDGEAGDMVPTGFTMTDVAVAGDTIVAVGYEAGDGFAPVVWTSTANGEWSRADLATEASGFVTANRVVGTPDGFVAVGIDQDLDDEFANETLVWFSRDGLDWAALSGDGFEAGDLVAAIETRDGRLVAVGTTGGFSSPQAAAWISDDAGQTWARAELPAPPSDRPITRMSDLAVGADGFVAVGDQAVNGDTGWSQNDADGPLTLNDQQDVLVWSSTDGQEWEQVGELRAPDRLAVATSVTAAPGGFLVSFTNITPDSVEGSSWITTNGTDFREIGHPDGRSLDVTAFSRDRFLSITNPVFGELLGPVDEPASALEIWELPATE